MRVDYIFSFLKMREHVSDYLILLSIEIVVEGNFIIFKNDKKFPADCPIY
jgi:hypothetical protein